MDLTLGNSNENDERWGPHMAVEGGLIVEPGPDPDKLNGEYNHRFGGNSWRVVDAAHPQGIQPTLLLTLDLRDPRLNSLKHGNNDELPLCSYIDTNRWRGLQVFRFDPETRLVQLLELDMDDLEIDEEIDEPFPQPLPETPVQLRPMQPADWPLTRDDYYRINNEISGRSTKFIRVLGPILWADYTEDIQDSNGEEAQFICSIGQESSATSTYIPGQSFWIGTGVLYFFLSRSENEIIVISQFG